MKFKRVYMIRVFVLALTACLTACSAFDPERIDVLISDVKTDTAWQEIQFQKNAVSTYMMNEVQLVTEERFLLKRDSGVVDSINGKRIGLEILLVSKGGQEYPLNDLAIGTAKKEKLIFASGPGLQTRHVGNEWSKLKIRSLRPFKIYRIQWYTYDPSSFF